MSQSDEKQKLYTTGEIAKLSGVSVRTVQYYDDRGILIPSELSEGGRRLYTEADLKRMHVICFLRDAGLPINSISALFAEEKPQNVISLLLEEQEKVLREELSERQEQLDLIEGIKRELKSIESFSVESIGDIAHVMKQKSRRSKMIWTMILTGLPVTALQWVAVILGITKGFWWLLGVWAAVAIPWGIWMSVYYYRHVAYICPECHETFSPEFKERFWAYHTPKMCRLTCPVCKQKRMCVEVYSKKEEKKNG